MREKYGNSRGNAGKMRENLKKGQIIGTIKARKELSTVLERYQQYLSKTGLNFFVAIIDQKIRPKN